MGKEKEGGRNIEREREKERQVGSWMRGEEEESNGMRERERGTRLAWRVSVCLCATMSASL